MSTHTKIEWADKTWNPVRGCTKVSPGCKNCYAETFAERFRGVSGHPYEQGFDLRLVPEKLNDPLTWRKPCMVFVNSMSDLFHDGVPDYFIDQVFAVMAQAKQHTFQILTKRTERMAWYSCPRAPLPNVWLGTSIEDQERADLRLPHLFQTKAAVRFLSVEPLLDRVYLQLARDCWDVHGRCMIDWVIVGGESGPGARPMNPDWARRIRDDCLQAGVPFFFKQWGTLANNPDKRDTTAKENGGTAKGGRTLDGRTWDEMPKGET